MVKTKTSMNVKVKGIRQLKRNIRKCQHAFFTELEDICKRAAEKIKLDAKSRVPVDTGAVQRNIIVDTVNVKKTGVETGVGVKGGQQPPDADYYYWYYIERGTKNMPAQPFLRPAFDENEELVKQMIKKGVMEMLERILR